MAQDDYQMDGAFHNWPRRPTLDVAANYYFLAAVGQVAVWIGGRALRLAMPGLSAQGLSWACSALFQCGFLLLPVLRYSAGRPGMLSGMRMKPARPLTLVLSAMAAVVMVFLADSLGTLWLLGLEALGARLSEPMAQPFSVPMALLITALLPALCEELTFRGLMLSAWERCGTRVALITSALLFTSLHGSVEGLPVHFVAGLCLGVVVVGADSLWAGMLFHFIYNALMLLLGVGGSQSTQITLLARVGGAPGVWLIALRMLIYASVLAGLIVALWRAGAAGRSKPPEMRQSLDLPGIVILAAGVVTMLCVYMIDLIGLWGVL